MLKKEVIEHIAEENKRLKQKIWQLEDKFAELELELENKNLKKGSKKSITLNYTITVIPKPNYVLYLQLSWKTVELAVSPSPLRY